jgi:RHS repeat-associated protein
VAATDPSGNLRTNTYQVNVSGTSKTFTHDSNGNMSANGNKGYEWNANNELIRALDGGNEVARFTYDGAGRRFQKIASGVTRTYVYGDEEILEERLSTGGTLRYVHAPAIDLPLAQQDGAGVVSYYIGDHLGSIVKLTSSGGEVILTRRYDPYGTPVAGSGQSGFAFTGREWDAETGLYYYRARYYDSSQARFISEDPLKFQTEINPYAYVSGNPVARVDPSGLIPIDTLWDIGNLIYDVVSGDWGSAAWDAAAMMLPYVPAGLSKGAKAFDANQDALGQVKFFL